MLGILFRVAWLFGWLIALPWLALWRFLGRTREGTYVTLEVDGPVEEIASPPRWWPPQGSRGARTLSLHGLRELVDEMTADSRVRGLVLHVKSMRAGLAAVTSLRGELARARAGGKRVVVHLPSGGGTRETYAAMAADRVLLGPCATLAPVGWLTSARYLRGALDRAGVVPEVHAHGRYKTAAERIERTSMSESEREQVGAVLDMAHGELLRAIAAGREVDEARARALVDEAPYAGEEAVAAGLVDGTAYEDELSSRLGVGAEKPRLRDGESYLRARTALRPGALRSRGVIAVVRVHGPITGGGGLPFRSTAVADRVIAAVRVARASPRVRGVILHVDSPGGSALASDNIHHELVQLALEKPLVCSMGNVAASGGYYVAAAAHAIVAQPTTITGSIGVIAARFVIDPLLSRLGIRTEVLQRGAHARLLDPLVALGDPERAAIDREIEHIYRSFLGVVATGRHRPVQEIETLAQGRVWTGAEAHARGLVDRLGGFEDALDLVRERLGQGAAQLRVVVVRPPRKPFPVLDPPERKGARLVMDGLSLLGAQLDLDLRLLALGGERVLAMAASLPSLK